MDEKKWQAMELHLFNNKSNTFFDSVKEYEKDMSAKWMLQQLEWIENGSYGAGACFALQRAIESKRGNVIARVGQVFIRATYGDRLNWHKLSKNIQNNMTAIVKQWLKNNKNFASDLII